MPPAMSGCVPSMHLNSRGGRRELDPARIENSPRTSVSLNSFFDRLLEGTVNPIVASEGPGDPPEAAVKAVSRIDAEGPQEKPLI